MKLSSTLAWIAIALPSLVAAYDDKIYGVNLGSWYVVHRSGSAFDAHASTGSYLNLGCCRQVWLFP